jgi:hypothetical protein
MADELNADRALSMEEWRAHRAIERLAANIMRIAAGAGEPHALVSEIVESMNALVAVRERGGRLPSGQDVKALLDIITGEEQDDAVDESLYREGIRIKDDIIQASLRVAAAKIMAQDVQMHRRMRDLTEALYFWDTHRQERRAAARSRR